MPRIDVPDDYERGFVSVAGRKDFSYNNGADVNTDAVAHARDLSIRADDDGTRYLGCSEHYADDVAEFLGVESPVEDGDETETSSDDEETAEESSDAEPETVTDGDVDPDEVAEDITADLTETIESGVCPWCDDYEGDGVPQHASAAHPDEWAEYKGAAE